MNNNSIHADISTIEKREKQYIPIILSVLLSWIAVRLVSLFCYAFIIGGYSGYGYHTFEVVGFLFSALLFINLMTKWRNGLNDYLLLKSLFMIIFGLVISNMVDIAVDHFLHNRLIYNTIFNIFYSLTAVALFTLVIVQIFTYYSKYFEIEDKIKNFFMPMYIKIAIIIYCSVMLLSTFTIAMFIKSYEDDQKKLISSYSKDSLISGYSSLMEYIEGLDGVMYLNKELVRNTISSNSNKIDRDLLKTVICSNILAHDDVVNKYFKNISVTIDSKFMYDNIETTLEIEDTEKLIYSIYTGEEIGKINFLSEVSELKTINPYSKTYISTIKYFDDANEEKFDLVINSLIYYKDEVAGYIKATLSGDNIRKILNSGINGYKVWTYMLYDTETYEIFDSNTKKILGENISDYYDDRKWSSFLEDIYMNTKDSYFFKVDNMQSNDDDYFVLALKISLLDTVVVYTAKSSDVISDTITYREMNIRLLIILLVVHIAVLLFTLFIHKILKAFSLASKYTMYIKDGKGDLRTRVEIESNDEVGDLAYNFNAFLSTLDNIIGEIKKESIDLDSEVIAMNDTIENSAKIVSTQTSNITETVSSVNNIMISISKVGELSKEQKNAFNLVSGSISDLLKTVMKINDSMTRQSASVEETSASIEEMISNINSVAKSVSMAEQLSSKLLNDAKAGGYSVDEVINAIRDIEESSDQIKNIIKVIQSIAEQTNLLAMNAAIEAAHAGDQGRGFAVVADQIRSLAENTADNTKTITAIIKDITKRIEKTLNIALDSGKSLESIVNASGSTAHIISEINIANTELEVGGRDMLETIKQLNIITQQVKDNVSEQINSSDIVDNQIKLLETITSDITNSIEVNSMGAKDIVNTMSLLTDLSEKSKNSNDNLFNALEKLNLKFRELRMLTFNFITNVDVVEENITDNESMPNLEDLDSLIEASKVYADSSNNVDESNKLK